MIVVDASAVVEVLLRTPLAERCELRLFSRGEALYSPYLIDVEVAQVLRRYAHRAEITAERGVQALEDLSDLPITRVEHGPFLSRMWELRHNLTAYDAAYVSLAEALAAPLITCDGRIGRAHGCRAAVEVIE